VPFYFIHLLPTSLLYISILLYDFSGETWAGDGSEYKGKMGADSGRISVLWSEFAEKRKDPTHYGQNWRQWLGHYRLHHRKSTYYTVR